MYLNRLNDEQKELFLDLCIQAAMANNDFSTKEKELIQLYCSEMQIANVRYKSKTSLEETLSKLIKISSKSEIMLIVLELTALILSNGENDNLDSIFIEKVLNATDISDSQHKEMIGLLNELTKIYNKFDQLIFDK